MTGGLSKFEASLGYIVSSIPLCSLGYIVRPGLKQQSIFFSYRILGEDCWISNCTDFWKREGKEGWK